MDGSVIESTFGEVVVVEEGFAVACGSVFGQSEGAGGSAGAVGREGAVVGLLAHAVGIAAHLYC